MWTEPPSLKSRASRGQLNWLLGEVTFNIYIYIYMQQRLVMSVYINTIDDN